jgi:hypothetical protein
VLKQNENQRIGWFRVFKKLGIKEPTGSGYLENSRRITVSFQFFDFYKNIWGQFWGRVFHNLT